MRVQAGVKHSVRRETCGSEPCPDVLFPQHPFTPFPLAVSPRPLHVAPGVRLLFVPSSQNRLSSSGLCRVLLPIGRTFFLLHPSPFIANAAKSDGLDKCGGAAPQIQRHQRAKNQSLGPISFISYLSLSVSLQPSLSSFQSSHSSSSSSSFSPECHS